jgi:HEAT repeat protein
MVNETKLIIATLLADADADLRRQAAEDLAESCGLASIAALAAALGDENKGVRDAATRTLLNIGGVNVARAIVEYIADENIVTRNLSASLLTNLGAVSVRALLPYLQEGDPDVKKIAVDILGLIKNEEAIPRLVPLLNDHDSNVSISAVEALGNIGSSAAVPHLFRAFNEQECAQAEIAEALGKIGDPSSRDFLELNFRLTLGNTARNPLVLYALLEALATVGNDHTLQVLGEQVQSVEGNVRNVLLHAIIRIAERVDYPISSLNLQNAHLIKAQSDRDPQIKTSAAKGLLSSNDNEATRALMKSFGISDELDTLLFQELITRDRVWAAAEEELDQPGAKPKKQIIDLIRRFADSLVPAMFRGGSGIINDEQMQRLFESVAKEWHEANQETRETVIGTLFSLDSDHAVQFLDEVLNDPDPWLRIQVIELLASRTNRNAVDFIARFLGDEDEMVREVAKATLQAGGYLFDIPEAIPQ